LIQILFLALVAASAFYALTDWRKGLLLMILVGMLQDPIRKLMPGAPGYMVLAFVPIWLAVCSAVLFSGNRAWSRFVRAVPSLVTGMHLVMFSLAVAFLVLLLNYGTSAGLVGAIGLLGYLLPIMAIAVGYHFVRNPGDLVQLIRVYCAIAAIALIGGVLERWKIFPEWRALGTDVLGTTWIRHYPGYIVELTSGFFRSPDLMGWHAAMLVMFSFLMGLRARTPGERVIWGALLLWGTATLLISGRNKMIFMPAIFILVFGSVQIYKGNFGRAMKAVTAVLMAGGLFVAVNSQLQLDDDYLLYAQKGSGEAVERLTQGGFVSVWTTYQQSGFFGKGLGTASTGARYGGDADIKTWQESGLSKIMVELGVIGFFAVLVFIGAITRSLWYLLKTIPGTTADFVLFAGLLGVLSANFVSFLVSHQAFGDPFLVTLAGLFLGILRSASRWPRPLPTRG